MRKDPPRKITSHHAIEEALRAGVTGATLYVNRSATWGAKLAALARERGVTVVESSRREVRTRGGDRARDAVLVTAVGAADSGTRGSAVARSATLTELLASPLPNDALVVVLDHITDPQNLGAIIRSCDVFGVSFCVSAERRQAPLTDAAVRASAGAAAHVELTTVGNINNAIDSLREAGFWIYGAAMGGAAAHQTDLRGRVALVVGSEGRGLSRLTAERVDALIGVPMGGHVDSLNASVAAGILLYETRRQQSWFA